MAICYRGQSVQSENEAWVVCACITWWAPVPEFVADDAVGDRHEGYG